MSRRINRYWRIEIEVRDSADEPGEIGEDISHLLGGYDIISLDVYEV